MFDWHWVCNLRRRNLRPFDSFTHFCLHCLSAVMEGSEHPHIVSTSNKCLKLILRCPKQNKAKTTSTPSQSEIFSLCLYKQGKRQCIWSDLRECAGPGRPLHAYKQREQELWDRIFLPNTYIHIPAERERNRWIYMVFSLLEDQVVFLQILRLW